MAFKTRTPEYINLPDREKRNFGRAAEIARKEGLEYLLGSIEGIEMLVKERSVDTLWLAVRETPMSLATRQNEYIVQMIDEFQYLNSEIYRDEATTIAADDFAAG